MNLTCWRHLFLVTLLLAARALFLQAQDPIALPEGVAPESEWAYSKHLEQLEQIMQNSNLTEREAQLENFMKKLDPKSKILQYYESYFSRTLDDYQKAGKTAEAQALSRKMLQLFPDSPALLAKSLQTALQAKDYATAIDVGEKIYSSKPDPQTAAMLASSYIATGNNAKAADYSVKALEGMGPKDGIYFVYWLAQYYTQQNNLDKALSYYDQMLKAFPRETPPIWNADQWKSLKTSAHIVKASVAYGKKDYAKAISAYHDALQLSPQNDEAYLRIGLSHWQLQQLDQAIEALAKAVVLGKASSGKAREYLEQLYKPRNNNSLDGLDAVLEKAKSELRL